MFRHCEGFNTYEETLNTLSSRSSQLQDVTGYKVNIYSKWDYQVHSLFIELALNKEQTDVEVIGSEGTSIITAPMADDIPRAEIKDNNTLFISCLISCKCS